MNIIRVWGVLVDYKPKRQRRWSRSLVRHGADARSAIAAVLGVSAEDLVTRDRVTDGEQVRPRSADPLHEGGSRSFLRHPGLAQTEREAGNTARRYS